MAPLAFREVRAEAFVHATESPEAVERALNAVLPGVRFERRDLGGHFGQALGQISGVERAPSRVAEAMDRVRQAVGPEVARSVERRLDEDLTLHIRFDKQEAFAERLRLESRPQNDVVKLQARLKATRRTRDDALARLVQQFSGATAPEEE